MVRLALAVWLAATSRALLAPPRQILALRPAVPVQPRATVRLGAADAAPGLIRMEGNLPIVDYSAGGPAAPEAIFRCPTNAIVWLDGEQFQEQEAVTVEVAR